VITNVIPSCHRLALRKHTRNIGTRRSRRYVIRGRINDTHRPWMPLYIQLDDILHFGGDITETIDPSMSVSPGQTTAIEIADWGLLASHTLNASKCCENQEDRPLPHSLPFSPTARWKTSQHQRTLTDRQQEPRGECASPGWYLE
jgi:hypothetical protein